MKINFLILVCKTVVLGLLMYFSARVFGLSEHTSLLLASIPIVLIALGIFSGFAFRLVAVVFLVACTKLVMLDTGYDQNRVAGSVSTLMSGAKSRLQTLVR
jgi:hypothetical protein